MNKLMKTTVAAGAILAATVSGSFAADASGPKNGGRLGILSCEVDGGWGAVIGSHKEVNCVFTKTNGKKIEYTGSIGRIGVDLGYVGNRKIVWAVLSAGNNNVDNLAGTYIGAGATAAVAVGIGANALVGGVKNSVVLNPLSIEGATGLYAAVGATSLTLE